MTLILNPQLSTFTLTDIPSSSMISTLVTQEFDIRGYPGCSFQAVYTGSPTGVFSCEATNGSPNDGTATWVEISDTPTPINSAGSYIWNLKTSYYAFVRLKYTFASGFGMLTVFAAAKGP